MLRKVLNIAGALILIVMLALVLPLTVPRLAGLQLYEVQTGSMTPALPVHSVIYVRPCEPETVQVGDVVTFRIESAADTVMTHRVTAIDDLPRPSPRRATPMKHRIKRRFHFSS